MEKTFNPISSEPIYKQLADVIEQKIFDGDLKPGDKLPSENEMCKEYNVSRITVRQSLNILTQRDLIYSVHGKGTFVKIAEIRQELSTIVKFGTALAKQDKKGFTKIVKYDTKKHPSKPTEVLGTNEYFELYLLGHILKTPVVYYKSFILNEYRDDVVAKAKELEKKGNPFSTLDIYDQLGVKISSVKQKVSAVNGNGKSAEMLKINGTAALLRLESTYYSGKKAIEFKTAYYRSDVYSFELNREVSFE